LGLSGEALVLNSPSLKIVSVPLSKSVFDYGFIESQLRGGLDVPMEQARIETLSKRKILRKAIGGPERIVQDTAKRDVRFQTINEVVQSP